MENDYGATVKTAFLTQKYSNIPTFGSQSQLSRETFYTPFHNVQKVIMQIKSDFSDVMELKLLTPIFNIVRIIESFCHDFTQETICNVWEMVLKGLKSYTTIIVNFFFNLLHKLFRNNRRRSTTFFVLKISTTFLK